MLRLLPQLNISVISEMVLRPFEIVSIVISVLFFLFLLWLTRSHIRQKQSDKFYEEVSDGYAAASSRGETSGRFEVKIKHPTKSSLTLYLQKGRDEVGPRYVVHFFTKVEKFPAGPKIMVTFNEDGVFEMDLLPSEASSSSDGSEESEVQSAAQRQSRFPTRQERPPFPTAPKLMEQPSPSYHGYRNSNTLNVQNQDIPSYEEVMNNPAIFSGVKPSTHDSFV